MNKKHVLTEALAVREEEVFHYQINLDNYSRAIEKAKKDSELEAFVNQLIELQTATIIEQKKAKIMLEVIKEQIAEIPE